MKPRIPILGTPTLLWTTAELNDDVAYNIVKTLIEYQEELASMHKDLKDWTLDTAVQPVLVPYHPEAIKYYREKGVWSEQMEQEQQRLLGTQQK